jgi:hypothetical protein
MSMLRRIGLICALALLAASVAAAQPGKLNVLSGSQFAVRGTAFKPNEHVLVVVTAAGQHGRNGSRPARRGLRRPFPEHRRRLVRRLHSTRDR